MFQNKKKNNKAKSSSYEGISKELMSFYFKEGDLLDEYRKLNIKSQSIESKIRKYTNKLSAYEKEVLVLTQEREKILLEIEKNEKERGEYIKKQPDNN